ncbi:MAG: aspartate aminotransferase family protein [Deltaproteobacteria bacterium]|nr:MAG: aspartate aminotransferase family protein [Deltaproteobacteria bacterium]
MFNMTLNSELVVSNRSNMSADYFYTWTKQDDAFHFEMESCFDHTLKLKDGSEKIDLTSLSYQAGFGYSCTPIIDKMSAQLQSLSIASAKADFSLKSRVTKMLLNELGRQGKIFYTTSGSESVENALKMAREQRKVLTVCARNVSYHGATLASLSVTGDWRNKAHKTLDDWTLRIPEPKDDPTGCETRKVIENYGPEKIAAIILETVTGGNGAFAGSEDYWNTIQNICDEHGIYLILDEVICGFYRTGIAFGFHKYPFLKPDFITLSKQITGGYIPFGAVYVSKSRAEFYDQNVLACGLTSYAHPLGLAALEGVFEVIDNNDFKSQLSINIKTLKTFCDKVSTLQNVREVRVHGLLAAIDVSFDPSQKEIFEKGTYLLTGPQRIMLAPALNMSTRDLESGLKIVEDYLMENI